MAEHLAEMAGALVRIRDGVPEVLTDPQIRFCPLRRDLYGIHEESRETVEKVIRSHITDLGMYSPHRVLELGEDPVSFGASEILMDGMAEGLVDAAVVVCDGAGTAVITRPDVLQAVGAHMTGLIKTEPVKAIQDGLEQRGCILIDRHATIDQIRGFVAALDAGFERVAVTLAGSMSSDARDLRAIGARSGRRPLILAVHTTGIGRDEAAALADTCDIIWSCASRAVREVAGDRAMLQMGVSIPVFAMTQEGKRLVLNRALHFKGTLLIHRSGLPSLHADRQPSPLI
ncbi:methanogenesis marker 8 protein [Methanothrix sp.]|uniref:methanogenesis marker 8 protein n=1 Tax=Methanothrix sp. TaxID=90426 RepID=UPI003C7334E5